MGLRRLKLTVSTERPLVGLPIFVGVLSQRRTTDVELMLPRHVSSVVKTKLLRGWCLSTKLWFDRFDPSTRAGWRRARKCPPPGRRDYSNDNRQ